MWSYDNTLDSLNMPLHIMFSGFTFGICSPFQFFLRYSTHFSLHVENANKYNSLLMCCGFDIETKDNEQGTNKQS